MAYSSRKLYVIRNRKGQFLAGDRTHRKGRHWVEKLSKAKLYLNIHTVNRLVKLVRKELGDESAYVTYGWFELGERL